MANSCLATMSSFRSAIRGAAWTRRCSRASSSHFSRTLPEGTGLGLAMVQRDCLGSREGRECAERSPVWALASLSGFPRYPRVDPLSRYETHPARVRRVCRRDRARVRRRPRAAVAARGDSRGARVRSLSDLLDPAEAAAACRWELHNDWGAATRFDAAILCSHLPLGPARNSSTRPTCARLRPRCPFILAVASAREFGAPARATGRHLGRDPVNRLVSTELYRVRWRAACRVPDARGHAIFSVQPQAATSYRRSGLCYRRSSSVRHETSM